jgi:hypothetical protein
VGGIDLEAPSAAPPKAEDLGEGVLGVDASAAAPPVAKAVTRQFREATSASNEVKSGPPPTGQKFRRRHAASKSSTRGEALGS